MATIRCIPATATRTPSAAAAAPTARKPTTTTSPPASRLKSLERGNHTDLSLFLSPAPGTPGEGWVRALLLKDTDWRVAGSELSSLNHVVDACQPDAAAARIVGAGRADDHHGLGLRDRKHRALDPPGTQ